VSAAQRRGSRAGGRQRIAPRCPVCAEPVVSGEVVVFDAGDLIHVDCRRNDPVPRLDAPKKARRPSATGAR